MISTFYNTASLFFETSLSSPLEPYCHIVHDFGLAGGIDNLKGSTSPRSLKVSLNAKKLGDYLLFSPLMNGTDPWLLMWWVMSELSDAEAMFVARKPFVCRQHGTKPAAQEVLSPNVPIINRALTLSNLGDQLCCTIYWTRGPRNIEKEVSLQPFVYFLVWLNIYLS